MTRGPGQLEVFESRWAKEKLGLMNCSKSLSVTFSRSDYFFLPAASVF